MISHLTIHNSILINATADKVWKALTDPAETPKYMFGCATVSDWKPGSQLLWQYHSEGKDIVAVKGIIETIDPNRFLAYTVFDPNSTMPDIPENYLTVTYALSEENGKTLLSVTQGDYATVAEGHRRYNEAYNKGEGWNPILLVIKELVESYK
jgi:uncharacterized protein YndB with AHSA1/START domain